MPTNILDAGFGTTASLLTDGYLVGTISKTNDGGRFSTGAVPTHMVGDDSSINSGDPFEAEYVLPSAQAIASFIIFFIADDYSGSRTVEPNTSEVSNTFPGIDFELLQWNGSSYVAITGGSV